MSRHWARRSTGRKSKIIKNITRNLWYYIHSAFPKQKCLNSCEISESGYLIYVRCHFEKKNVSGNKIGFCCFFCKKTFCYANNTLNIVFGHRVQVKSSKNTMSLDTVYEIVKTVFVIKSFQKGISIQCCISVLLSSNAAHLFLKFLGVSKKQCHTHNYFFV